MALRSKSRELRAGLRQWGRVIFCVPFGTVSLRSLWA